MMQEFKVLLGNIGMHGPPEVFDSSSYAVRQR